jgi:hypothetical protein
MTSDALSVQGSRCLLQRMAMAMSCAHYVCGTVAMQRQLVAVLRPSIGDGMAAAGTPQPRKLSRTRWLGQPRAVQVARWRADERAAASALTLTKYFIVAWSHSQCSKAVREQPAA